MHGIINSQGAERNTGSPGFPGPCYCTTKHFLVDSTISHPKGLVWQVSTKLSTTPMRGVLNGIDSDDNDASVDESAESCPDNDFIKWEWFNSTTSQGQQLYVKDEHIQVKCIS